MEINNYFRMLPMDKERNKQDYRSPYRRDYARVLHSPSFRRLCNKTQLFPGSESDFFRNRLTHSLEVAQIAKTIAQKIKAEHPDADIEPDVCEIAGMIHDIGHPPFGHNGEFALDECMIGYGGFEGNAQTLRIITRLEKKECPPQIITEDGDQRVGLNLTARVIASALKYDKPIPQVRKSHSKGVSKGYYKTESDIVKSVKAHVVGSEAVKDFKAIECQIMDLADDIAYSTYDMEDAFKAAFLTPYDIMAADDSIYEQVVEKLKKDKLTVSVKECREAVVELFTDTWSSYASIGKAEKSETDPKIIFLKNSLASYRESRKLAQDGYCRTDFTSRLVNMYINGISYSENKEHPVLSSVSFDGKTKLRVNIMKHFAYVCLINSSRLKIAENRSMEIIKKMFQRLSEDDGYRMLPEDCQHLYFLNEDDTWRARVICDFIAGMTDRYALEFYGRLFSENGQTIFKPL